MRWPIRNQILLPVAVIQVAAIGVISIATAMMGARRAELDAVGRMQDVVQSLSGTSLPLNKPVLEKMRALSGAEFAENTSGNLFKASTFSARIPTDDLPSKQPNGAPLTLDPSRSVEVAGEQYLVGRVELFSNTGPTSLLVFYPEQKWQTARRDALLPPMVIGAGTLLVMVGVSTWLASRMGGRMRTIEDQVARVAGGDFKQIELEPRDDEIRDLADSVNRMSVAMQRMTAGIRDSERAALITQLAGGLAHQLRNAITGARMAVQVHDRRCESDDESLGVALSQLKLTEAQVNGLLRMTRDDRRVPVSGKLAALIENVVALVKPMCEHASVELGVDTDISTESAVSDADGLQAAVLNLVLNAIQAAGPSGGVRIACDTSADHQATIAISDNGPGVADEIAESLFDPFVTTKPEGVGLGLALAKQAAAEHGGTLTYRREEDWTMFRLSLQLTSASSE